MGFGDHGQYNLPITGYDYVTELHDVPEPGAPPVCVYMLNNANDGYGIGEDVVVLGSAFLGAFYTTFDMEQRSVSCKSNTILVIDSRGASANCHLVAGLTYDQ